MAKKALNLEQIAQDLADHKLTHEAIDNLLVEINWLEQPELVKKLLAEQKGGAAPQKPKSEAAKQKELEKQRLSELKKVWFTGKQDDGTLIIKGYRGSDKDVVIPAEIGGVAVTAIDEYALSPSKYSLKPEQVSARRMIRTVVISEGVTKIGHYAFYGCPILTSITIPDSVTWIGEGAFKDCTKLTSITIPACVTQIGDSALSYCTRLTTITIPAGVTRIGNSAFQGCTKLTSITIPASVTEIGEYAFWRCTGLTSVTIPEGVTEIGENAFEGCTGPTSVTIPNSVTKIGYGAFKDCTGLTSVTIPEGVTVIGWGTFCGCAGLTIHAPAGSAAEKYAKENNIPFAAI